MSVRTNHTVGAGDSARARRLRWRIVAIALLAAIAAPGYPAGAADVTSIWTGAAGMWSTPGNWVNTPNVPLYPSNGNGGFTYDAIVPQGGPVYITGQVTVDALSAAANLTITNASSFTIRSGLSLQDTTLTLADQGGATSLEFADDQAIEGPGQIIFGGGASRSSINIQQGTLTIASDVTIRTGTAGGLLGFSWHKISTGAIVNHGVISAQTPGQILTAIARPGNYNTNDGLLEARDGATLIVNGHWINQAGGRIEAGDGGTVTLGGAVAPGWINEPGGVIAVKGTGTLLLGAYGTNTGVIDVSGRAVVQAPFGERDQLFALLQASLRAGHEADWAWPASGFTSSAARDDARGLTALAAIRNADAKGNAIFEMFAGRSVNTDSILAMYTYYGDANLDGVVNADDYHRIDQGAMIGSAGWYNGDFNYDNIINADDYFLIDSAFLGQGAALPGAAFISAPRAAAVPEPATLLLAPALLLLARRRPARTLCACQ